MTSTIHIVDTKMTPTHDTEHGSIIEQLRDDLTKLNHSIVQAVEHGVSVELIRTSRHHNGHSNWGDILAPIITQNSDDK